MMITLRSESEFNENAVKQESNMFLDLNFVLGWS